MIMELDERIINYMKIRNEYARMIANVAASLLFALAGFFCLYALYAGGVFYSGSLRTAKTIIFTLTILISIAVSVIGVLASKKIRRVYIKYPDAIALRGSEDVVREAYFIARPVLIHKITLWCLVFPSAALVYIMLMIFMEDYVLAEIYGKIVLSLAAAIFTSSVIPCFDRIVCYRGLLNEIHVLSDISDEQYTKRKQVTGYILSIAVPAMMCVWFLMRHYSNYKSIAWIVLPIGALLAFAVIFLSGWVIQEKNC